MLVHQALTCQKGEKLFRSLRIIVLFGSLRIGNNSAAMSYYLAYEMTILLLNVRWAFKLIAAILFPNCRNTSLQI